MTLEAKLKLAKQTLERILLYTEDEITKVTILDTLKKISDDEEQEAPLSF